MRNGVAGEELTVFMVVPFLQERQGEPQDSIARNHLPVDHGHEPIEDRCGDGHTAGSDHAHHQLLTTAFPIGVAPFPAMSELKSFLALSHVV